MTPKEKAAAMILKYTIILEYDFVSDLKWYPPNDTYRNQRIKKDAKKCALAALEYIIEQNNVWIIETGKGTNNYWLEVKQEIIKL
ncbi:MAG: hypothetical protein ACOYMA_06190 [Bacteroidia bacterium]